MLCFRVGDKEYRLVESVGGNWKKLGVFLELNYTVLTAIERDKKFSEDCCLEVLHKWLSGEASEPTWGTLIEALRLVELTGLAAELKELLPSR